MHQRGTGHLLKKHKGPGNDVITYGGSMHLVDAGLTNIKLEDQFHDHQEELHATHAENVKKNYRRRLSILEFLEELQNAATKVKYLDGIERGKPKNKSHKLRRRNQVVEENFEETKNLTKSRKLSSSLSKLEQIYISTGACQPTENMLENVVQIRPSTEAESRSKYSNQTENATNFSGTRRKISKSCDDLTDFEIMKEAERGAQLRKKKKHNAKLEAKDEDVNDSDKRRRRLGIASEPQPAWLD